MRTSLSLLRVCSHTYTYMSSRWHVCLFTNKQHVTGVLAYFAVTYERTPNSTCRNVVISLLYNWMFLSSVISYYTTSNSSSMLAFPKLIILATLITLFLKSQVRLLQQAQFGANTFFFMLDSHHPLSRICLEIMLCCFLRVSFSRVSESITCDF